MKFILLSLLLLVAIFHEGICSVSVLANAKHPDHPNKCYTKESATKVTLFEIGETKNIPNQCTTATCNKDFSISLTSCDVPEPGAGCKIIPGDLTKEYPKCCDTVSC